MKGASDERDESAKPPQTAVNTSYHRAAGLDGLRPARQRRRSRLADKRKALNSDVELNFYIDDKPDYDRAINWDPASTDTSLMDKCLKKFYDEEKAQAANAKISRYKVKGSELHIETMVEKSDGHRGPNGPSADRCPEQRLA